MDKTKLLHATSSDRLRRWVHICLLAGVLTSGAMLVLGVGLAVHAHQPRPPAAPPPFDLLIRAVWLGDSLAVLNLGLLVLMFTPMLRVAALCLGWLIERQWFFAAIAGTVLALLAISLILGVR